MPASENVRQLVKRFEANRESYRSGKYNETQLRREFLDPFFEALGWDIFNKGGYAETYKDVIHEDSLEIEGENKAPDYSFRIGGVRKFFVEAKKPAVNIESNIHPAFQLRRYAWSAKFPISILTDFEEFAVYDCRAKPDKKDKASLGRISLYSFKDYIDKWDEIAAVFSRDAVLKGSFDQYAEGLKGKKGTTEVDDAFLAEIERWRDLLAKNIALRNPSLNVRELNYAVQMTIDRIIFLRICEDRGVERDYQLKEIATNPLPASPRAASATKVLGNQETLNADLGEVPDRAEGVGSVYAALCQLFKKADARYNSGLFHFPAGRFAKEEKEQSGAADSLTLSLNVDDKVLQDILKNLYYPESPYVFREIPSDILGQVYERFLGKVIRLTAGHQAKVEEKPEVRKAGGVYYTPTYIVEYIVQNTVGKLLAARGESGIGKSGIGLTPKEVAKLKFLDPACGSGTFPLGAFQYLLDWHLKYYLEHEPEKWMTGKSPAIYQVKDGYRLTTSKKKEILLNNIYGVDIDPQAVEVTKLSLLLKVLEGESNETIGSQLALFQERVLPDLGRNIKCGNSLIGYDYFEGRMLVEQEERERVNAFDWKAEFPQVFDPHRPSPFGHFASTSPKSAGEKTSQRESSADLGEAGRGFDAVFGNPPYIRIQVLQETSSINVEYYKKTYKAASKGNYDIYVVFVEKALSLLNEKGRLGFILPHKFFNAQYGAPLRGVIANGKHLAKVVYFGDQQVFENATTYTCLMFLDREGHDEFEFEKVQNLDSWRTQTSEFLENPEVSTAGKINVSRVTESEWNFSLGKDADLFVKLSNMPIKLGDVTEKIFQGLVTSSDSVYFLEPIDAPSKGYVKVKSKATDKEYELEDDVVRSLIKGSRDISRYSATPSKRVLFPYDPKKSAELGKTILISSDEFSKKYPRSWKYLQENFDTLRDREKGKMRHEGWYGYVYPKSVSLFGKSKILTPSIAAQASFVYDKDGEFYFVGSGGGGGGGYGIIINDSFKISYEYLLGLLNSKLLDYFLKKISSPFQGGYFAFSKQYIELLPIHSINFSDPAEKAMHDKMVSLVERMLELHKRSPRTPQEQEIVKREIESTDRGIDKLVYELYGLSEDEIGIVEGK